MPGEINVKIPPKAEQTSRSAVADVDAPSRKLPKAEMHSHQKGPSWAESATEDVAPYPPISVAEFMLSRLTAAYERRQPTHPGA
jgi:hypothetical protein